MIGEAKANDIKIRGIGAIEAALAGGEAVITHRGKAKFIVLTPEKYRSLRDCRLAAEIAETQRDVKRGNYKAGTPEDHLKRLNDE